MFSVVHIFVSGFVSGESPEDRLPEHPNKSMAAIHRALDEAVDRLYRKEPFASDRERVEHLFGLYEKLTAPVLAAAAKPKRERKK